MQQRLPILIILLLAVVAGVVLMMNRDTEEETATTPASEASTAATAETGTLTVTLDADGFSPSEIQVSAGQSVRFVNGSGSPAIFASDPHPQHTDFSELESESIADGDSYLFVFEKPGEYGMHNHLNAGQTATVTVK